MNSLLGVIGFHIVIVTKKIVKHTKNGKEIIIGQDYPVASEDY